MCCGLQLPQSNNFELTFIIFGPNREVVRLVKKCVGLVERWFSTIDIAFLKEKNSLLYGVQNLSFVKEKRKYIIKFYGNLHIKLYNFII